MIQDGKSLDVLKIEMYCVYDVLPNISLGPFNNFKFAKKKMECLRNNDGNLIVKKNIFTDINILKLI